MRPTNRWKVVLIVTLFNMLLEYSLRGVNDLLVRPILPFALFITYFAYFTMVEDLIARYRLEDYQVWLVALLFGLTFQLFVPSGGAFVPPLFLGVNWSVVLFVNLIWWCPIQTVMGFYIANRIAPRDWNHPLLPKLGWALSIFAFLFLTLIYQKFGGGIIPINPLGALMFIVIMVATGGILSKSIQSRERKGVQSMAFTRDRLMDILSWLTIFVMLGSAFFLRGGTIFSYIHPVNRNALGVVMLWSTFTVMVMLIHRIFSKRPIPV